MTRPRSAPSSPPPGQRCAVADHEEAVLADQAARERKVLAEQTTADTDRRALTDLDRRALTDAAGTVETRRHELLRRRAGERIRGPFSIN